MEEHKWKKRVKPIWDIDLFCESRNNCVDKIGIEI